MTYDQSGSKFWYNGEYEELSYLTLEEKLMEHKINCPIGTDVGALLNEA